MTRPPIIRTWSDAIIADRDDLGRFTPGARSSIETEFKPGERRSPRTEIRRGQRHSPATEFKPGQPARNKLPLGTVTVRVEANTGLSRAWVKVAEPNVWRKRAVVVWESLNGSLPRGYVVHHKDRNSLNDDPSNLVALTRKEHTDEHRLELAVALVKSLEARSIR